MNQDESNTSGQSEIAEAKVQHGRRMSLIWIFPIVAAIAAVGLGYRTYQQKGPTITITLPTAEGLEAGKSVIRYKDVAIGSVKKIELSADTTHTVITGEMQKSATPLLVEGTRFWVVRPQVSAAGITGLGTLLAGHFITLSPGPSGRKPATEFQGLVSAPIDAEGEKVLELVLEATKLGGVAEGAPVYFRDVPVGRIGRHELADNGEDVKIHLIVHAKYANLVHKNTRFWNVGGLSLTAGWRGVDVDLGSIRSLLVGGVAFDTPGKPEEPATNGMKFQLYAHRKAALGDKPPIAPAEVGLELVLKSETLGGVSEGAPVYHLDVPVGRVERHAFDRNGRHLEIHIAIEKPFTHLVRENTRFWNASGVDISGGFTGLQVHMATVQSLLAGGIAFDTPDPMWKEVKDGHRYTLYPHRTAAMARHHYGKPLLIVVESERLGSLKDGDPVYYREEQVGKVERHALHPDAQSVGILLSIGQQYSDLVRTNTVFWNASGISAKLGLTGLKIQTESLASLLEGGVSFATPNKPGALVAEGSVFRLQTKLEDDWLKWSPQIWIGPGKNPQAKSTTKREREPQRVHHKAKDAKKSGVDLNPIHWFKHLFSSS